MTSKENYDFGLQSSKNASFDDSNVLVVRHSSNHLLIGIIAWVIALLAFITMLTTPIQITPDSSLINTMAPGGVAILLFLGGAYSFLYRLRWSLKLKDDTLTLMPVIGPIKSYRLDEITEFKVIADRFLNLPGGMRRELGNQDPTTIVEAMHGKRRAFSITTSDVGFHEFCDHLDIKLPDYEELMRNLNKK